MKHSNTHPDPDPDLIPPAPSSNRQRRYLSTGEVVAIVPKSVNFLYEQEVHCPTTSVCRTTSIAYPVCQ